MAWLENFLYSVVRFLQRWIPQIFLFLLQVISLMLSMTDVLPYPDLTENLFFAFILENTGRPIWYLYESRQPSAHSHQLPANNYKFITAGNYRL